MIEVAVKVGKFWKIAVFQEMLVISRCPETVLLFTAS
jgi:hypothetical protein